MKKQHIVGGLSERIQEAVSDKGIDITILAKRLCISRSLLYGYMYYDIMPQSNNLRKMAVELNVSADWLLGISNRKELVR